MGGSKTTTIIILLTITLCALAAIVWGFVALERAWRNDGSRAVEQAEELGKILEDIRGISTELGEISGRVEAAIYRSLEQINDSVERLNSGIEGLGVLEAQARGIGDEAAALGDDIAGFIDGALEHKEGENP